MDTRKTETHGSIRQVQGCLAGKWGRKTIVLAWTLDLLFSIKAHKPNKLKQLVTDKLSPKAQTTVTIACQRTEVSSVIKWKTRTNSFVVIDIT